MKISEQALESFGRYLVSAGKSGAAGMREARRFACWLERREADGETARLYREEPAQVRPAAGVNGAAAARGRKNERLLLAI